MIRLKLWIQSHLRWVAAQISIKPQLVSVESALCMCDSRFRQIFGQSLEFSLSGSHFARILISLSSNPCCPKLCLLRQDWWWAIRVWSSHAAMTMACSQRKLKSWETQQMWTLFLQVYIPLQNLPAFVHSPEPSGCHFLSRVFVISERAGGLGGRGT